MSTAYLNSKIEERAMLAASIIDVLDKAAEKSVDPTPEQRSQIENWESKIKNLDVEITQLNKMLDANDRFTTLVQNRSDAEENRERRELEKRNTPADPVELTISKSLTESDAFKEYRGHGRSARIEVTDIFGLETRATITTAQTVPPVYRWPGTAGPTQVTPFLDAINRERVSTGSFDYVTWTIATGVALVAEQALKPEVAVSPTLETKSLDTYAGWVAITRQALEDSPRIQSAIESRLRQNLAAVLESAAVDELESATVTAVTETGLAGIRVAQATVQSAGYRPTGLIIAPEDAAALDIDVMGTTTNGPVIPGSYWGLTPIPVPGLTPGTAYVGDWSQAITWFDRGTTDVYVSDSHNDFFIRNIFVILAEARAAFAVTEPNAVVSVDLATGA